MNGSWTAIGSPLRGTGNLAGYSIQTFYFAGSAAGTPTVTMTCSGTNVYRAIAIHEYYGPNSSSVLEASTYSGMVTASGDVITTASGITTTSPVCMLFCAALVDNAVTGAVAPFTLRENANFGSNGTADRDVYATGTYTASFNTTGTTDAGMILVAFRSSPATLPGTQNIVLRTEINGSCAPKSATSPTPWAGTYDAKLEIDTGTLKPYRTARLAIVAKTSVSATGRVRLKCTKIVTPAEYWNNTAIAAIDIPTGTTSYTYFESQQFEPPVGQKLDLHIDIDSPSSGTLTVLSWKLVLAHGTGTEPLRLVETHIEVGDEETKTNTTSAPLNYPKYFKYVSADYDGTKKFFYTLTYATSGANLLTVKLQQDDGAFANWADHTTLVDQVSGYAHTVGDVNDLTDGRNYRLVAFTNSGSYTIYNCKILIVQYEGATVQDPGLHDNAFDILGGTAGSGETSQAHAQSFTLTTGTKAITGVRLSLIKTGTPSDNLVVNLVSTLGGSSLAQGTLAASSVTASWIEYDITFAIPYTPSLSTTYYLQITRSGARDASNYVSVEGSSDFDDSPGQASIRSNNSWAAENYDLGFRLLGITGLTKTVQRYLVANTKLAAGTALQGFLTNWDSSEWVGVNNVYKHCVDAADNSTSDVQLEEADGGGTVTGSLIENPDNQGIGGAMTMPASQLLDLKATTNNSDVYGSRILAIVSIVSGISVSVREFTRSSSFSGAG